jgi:N-acetyl-anhydromuramyl-L-alanine amidase AmpD
VQRFSKRIDQLPSPTHSSRRGLGVYATVVHFDRSPNDTAGRAWLVDSAARASAHFTIARTGETKQLVDLSQAAWHAGVSEMTVDGRLLHGANLFTIGIELANVGPLVRGESGKLFWEDGRTVRPFKPEIVPVHAALVFPNGYRFESLWEPYPEPQLRALESLLDELAANGFERAAKNLVGHEEIATPSGRKVDPGGAFGWGRFARFRSSPPSTRIEVLAA